MTAKQKVALVTGGTAGVGLSVVRALVTSGAFVHFIGTNERKGARIERELNATSEPVCRFIKLDLSRLREVQSFCRQFENEVRELHVLANIAGVMLHTRVETDEGNEKTFAINHLAAFILCQELRPSLAMAKNARIVNVSGAPTYMLKPSLDFDDLQLAEGYTLSRAAITAVHAKTVMTEILADQFAADGIDVNAFHPGAVKSDLFRNLRFPMRHIFQFGQLFMPAASKSGIYVSTSEEVTGMTGQLFVGTKARKLSFEREYKDRLLAATKTLVSASTLAPLATEG